MNDPIKLNQAKSNLLCFLKYHYREEDFWFGIGEIYMHEYDMMDVDYVGIYHMIADVFLPYIQLNPARFTYLFTEYENLSLPDQSWKVWGGLSSLKAKDFDSTDLVRARIAAMGSILRLSEIRHFDYMKPTEYEKLKLKN